MNEEKKAGGAEQKGPEEGYDGGERQLVEENKKAIQI